MAVLDDCPGLKAEIIVYAQPLEEYVDEDEEDPPKTVTKYVEAQSGAEFALKWKFSTPFPTQYGVQAVVHIDGVATYNTVMWPEDLHGRRGFANQGGIFEQDGVRFIQNYRFTALNIVEESDGPVNLENVRKDVGSKGCITLTLRFITNIRRSGSPNKARGQAPLSAMGAVPEKALKGDARSHQTTYVTKHSSCWPRVRYDKVDNEPFATVVFRYRSLAALKALRIIRDVEKANKVTPTIPLLLQRMRRREAERRDIKQETGIERQPKRELVAANDNDDNDEVTVIETRCVKRPRGEPEVIVLD
ncbi:hypothetical protein P153DRAFT_295534 [Dothidotthia symphoricarpi CBS 119687]|uniref:DUF7918 domain-containing protein n=1 Tax=Dothidotthia symphoricarpi CBS 119687 TaxID=1392245 RepID=A0A6A6A7Y6_9PLEO|nr:uncharacterized protein P153DRAFT_295534 [Dothidotthia symphoricarpi CBS 119687]KAF2127283.1 hypothetical protein P153DRAFT_295534 [Dothidotthia symphoricarpi CBS 119687]